MKTGRQTDRFPTSPRVADIGTAVICELLLIASRPDVLLRNSLIVDDDKGCGPWREGGDVIEKLLEGHEMLRLPKFLMSLYKKFFSEITSHESSQRFLK